MYKYFTINIKFLGFNFAAPNTKSVNSKKVSMQVYGFVA